MRRLIAKDLLDRIISEATKNRILHRKVV